MRRALAALVLAVAVLVIGAGQLSAAPVLAPAAAVPDAGSTIFQRFWDSLVSTWKNRTEGQSADWLRWIEQGEELFLGETADLTAHPAVQDAVAAMRVIGAVLLALCAVLSLSELTVGQMTGGGFGLGTWFWRLSVATVMTFGTIPIAGALLRFANYLLYEVRSFMDRHWSGGLPELYRGFFGLLGEGTGQILLILIFLAILTVIMLGLWFIYGGIHTAEVVIHLLLWPLTWPFYLLPSTDDIPKTATRGFLMWAALPILVTLMLRTAVRLVVTSSLWGTVWAFIPAIALAGMTLFLPMAVRRVLWQGHTGTSVLASAARVITGLKLATVAGAAGAAMAAPAPAGGAAMAAPTPMRPAAAPSLHPMPAPMMGMQPATAFGTGYRPWQEAAASVEPAPVALPAPAGAESPAGAPAVEMRCIGMQGGQAVWVPASMDWPDGGQSTFAVDDAWRLPPDTPRPAQEGDA